MKKTGVLAACMLGITLLGGCTKDRSTDALQRVSNNIIYTDNSIPYPVAINFKLAILPSTPSSIIIWNSGSVHANEIIFNAVRKNGNALIQSRFGTMTGQSVGLSDTKIMGNVYAPATKYDHGSFTIGLDTVKGTSSLTLSGSYYRSGSIPAPVIPVQVMINEPVNLNTIWIYNAPNGIAMYWDALIELSTDQLISGINADMINNATLTDGVLLITNTSNKNLYDIIVGNLQNNVMQAQFSVQDISTPGSVKL